MSGRQRVSLCMIVRDEEHNLEACLAPVAHLFDEIIIIDTGSHDRTVEIARRFTQHVHHLEWCDDFAAARNVSLRHATGDWIFWLDADDRISPENVERLKATLGSLPNHPVEYMMDVVCRPPTLGAPETLISHPRLFRRHADLHWHGRVHEQLRPCPITLGFEVVYSDVRIEHVGYADAAVRQKKRRRDLRLLRMDYAVDPEDASTLFHLGQICAELGTAEESRKYLSRLLEAGRPPCDCMRAVFATLCELALAEGKFQEALAIADRALAMFPRNPRLMYLLAEALYELDQYAAAESALREIINLPETLEYHAGAPNQLQRKLAPQSLGELLRIQGKYAAAEAVLRKVVTEFPDHTIAWHTLGRVYVDTGNVPKLDEARAMLERCLEGRVFSLLLLAAWQLVRGEPEAAGPVLDELIAAAPLMPMPRIMRTMLLDRHGAPLADRLRAYRDVLRVQPGNAHAQAIVSQLEAEIERSTKQPAFAAIGPQDWCSLSIVGSG